jgi:transcriptional regulator with XRE-family HTH domain
MGDRDNFGQRLRRERERRGLSLEQIAAETKVSVDLWQGLERGDLSRWPAGIFARAFVRTYATRLGLNAKEILDEFCRLYPLADRRAEALIRAQAETIGVPSEYADDRARAPRGPDRRGAAPPEGPDPPADAPGAAIAQRTLAASLDMAVVLVCSLVAARVTHRDVWMPLGVLALSYYSLAFVAFGATPAALLIDFLRQRIVGLPPAREIHPVGARR